MILRRRRLLLTASVALVAAAALAYQLLLLRLLGIVQWHVLAGMVVSLALLGHGASGTALALCRHWARRRAVPLYVLAALLFAMAAPLCFALAQRVPFNALELVWDPGQWPRLAAVYGLLAAPFFFAASCFGLVFMRFGPMIPRLYGADLLGAGVGAIALLLLLWWLTPDAALRAVAQTAVAGALMAVAVVPRRRRAVLWATALPVAVAGMLWPQQWLAPLPSEFKGQQRLQQVMGAELLHERHSPWGQLAVLDSPRVPLRHAPGLSLHAQHEPPSQLAVFTDGDAMQVVTRTDDPEALDYLQATTMALPHALRHAPRVLVLQSGGGEAVLRALHAGADSVHAVEPNPQLLELVRTDLAVQGGAVYDAPRVYAEAADPRTVLRRGGSRYDLIEIPASGSPAGTGSGVLAAAESYLYTVEALRDALRRLAPDGVLAVTVWEREPPRDGIKLLATAVAALQADGEDAAATRLAMIRSWQTSTLLLRRGAFPDHELEAVRRFADERGFDLVALPGIRPEEANRFNVVERPWLFEAAQALLHGDGEDWLARYRFQVRPATDDRPFFHHFFRWATLPELHRLRGQGAAVWLDAGYLVLVATIAQALIYSLLLILLPLLALPGPRRQARSGPLLYFLCLGMAFLFIEIAWLQRLVLLLGHPLLAFGAGLGVFLVFAGAGSMTAGRLYRSLGARAMATAVAALLAAVLAAEILWRPALGLAPEWPLAGRAVLAAVLLAPLAFCMGFPFALGLRRLSAESAALVPWAWGINGCASVLSAVLATWLAMHAGFQAVIIAGGMLYVAAALVWPARV